MVTVIEECPSRSLILGTVDPDRAGAAAAVQETAFELGGALGVAVLGSVLTASYRAHLPPVAGPTELRAAFDDSIGAAHSAARAAPSAPADGTLRIADVAFTNAFATTATVSGLILAVGAAIAACTLPKEIDDVNHR